MSDDDQTVTAALVLADSLVKRVQSHPVSTLAGAAGVGVILARGLPDTVLRLGASLAMRAAAARVIGHIAASSDGEPPITPPVDPTEHDPRVDVAATSS